MMKRSYAGQVFLVYKVRCGLCQNVAELNAPYDSATEESVKYESIKYELHHRGYRWDKDSGWLCWACAPRKKGKPMLQWLLRR